jgi:hypothetical protein
MKIWPSKPLRGFATTWSLMSCLHHHRAKMLHAWSLRQWGPLMTRSIPGPIRSRTAILIRLRQREHIGVQLRNPPPQLRRFLWSIL